MSMEIDKYFKIFKIENIKTMTLQELKRRFRILVKIAHPDRGGSPAKFRLVNDAYKYLTVLVKQHLKKESQKFFNNNHLFFYGDGSVFDTKKKRWSKIKGKIINIKT